MSDKFQLRLILTEEFAKAARKDMDDPVLQTLTDTLKAHGAVMNDQWSNFLNYLVQSTQEERDANPALAELTINTIRDLEKHAKYEKTFVVYKDGEELLKETAAVKQMMKAFKALEGQGVVKEMQIVPVARFHS